MSKFSFPILVFILSSIFLVGCKRGEKNEEVIRDTSLVESSVPEVSQPKQQESAMVKSQIVYQGAWEDEARAIMQSFMPFENISYIVKKSISVRDSLAYTHDGKLDFTHKDSLIFRSYEIKAYAAIMEYKKSLAAGTPLRGQCPSLLDLTRNMGDADSSVRMLPKAEPSKFFSGGKFFFIGGAPFIGERMTDNGSTFTDAAGNPEVRLINNDTENGLFILNSLYNFKKNAMNVAFGDPLSSYYGFHRDVNGVGSLIHNFNERIPVYFITESGVVPAHIISVTVKLVPEGLGCQSDQPTIEFACSKNIKAADILSVYIPYTSSSLTSCNVTREGNALWTADLDADGVPDLACVSSSYEGIASGGTLSRAIWFVNINGTWKVIDYANENDCT